MNRQESIKHLKDEWFSFTNTMKESLETLIPELKGYDENSVKDWLINKLTNFKELSQASNNANNVKIANAAIKWVENAEQPVNISKEQEWSEEDEEIFNNIIEKAKGGHWIEVNEITWLTNHFKSLHPQSQKLEDWTEEDEKALNCIINVLDRLGFEEYCNSSRDQDVEEEQFYYKEIQVLKKLKFLLPQPKELQ